MSAPSSTVDAPAETPFTIALATVATVERISPSFARITFVGDDVNGIGTPGQSFDQRIKFVFPGEAGVPTELRGADNWYTDWLAIPEERRGAMRTYSIRDLIVDNGGTRLVVDFVLHLEEGLSGPASHWADAAQPGDQVLIAAPRRGRLDGGGIEFAPGDAQELVLVGDETAAPAIARILEDLGPDARGQAFIEVPVADDAVPIDAPAGVTVHWIARDGVPHGQVLLPRVLAALDALGAEPLTIHDVASEDLVWETPVYSGLGESLEPRRPHADRYFWIAGESGVVTTMRRQLVKHLGVDRSQVAFMGYWRVGVAMRG